MYKKTESVEEPKQLQIDAIFLHVHEDPTTGKNVCKDKECLFYILAGEGTERENHIII